MNDSEILEEAAAAQEARYLDPGKKVLSMILEILLFCSIVLATFNITTNTKLNRNTIFDIFVGGFPASDSITMGKQFVNFPRSIILVTIKDIV